MSDFTAALEFLASQSSESLLAIFWFVILFEIPRYGLAFAAVGLAPLASRYLTKSEGVAADHVGAVWTPRVTVIVAGHNESDRLEACIGSLREQSLGDLEIVIVSDGSTDAMSSVAARLVRSGLADRILTTTMRGGKSSAANLGVAASSGDIIVVVDCDCSFDRFAIANIIAPMRDPAIGAVCGNIVPRNAGRSLVARCQQIEYLFAITVGKLIGNAIDQVVCVSGAFGAFRREALKQIGSFDVGGGEDLDSTIRLRMAGWKVVFAPDAVCYTDVPASAWALVRQRRRWERDALWLRFRKHWRLLNPFNPFFSVREALHQWDFLIFNVVASLAFPVYVVWLAGQYGQFAVPILIASYAGLFALDVLLLAIVAGLTDRRHFIGLLPHLPAYSLYSGYGMRFVRLHAYAEEFFLFASRRDEYVPLKVRRLRPW